MSTTEQTTTAKESRIGKQAVVIPSGVKVTVGDGEIEVVGPKGRLTAPIPRGISAKEEDGRIRLRADSGEDRARHGLARALLANAVKGVTDGFSIELDIVGVGYKAEQRGSRLVLALGYSHSVEFLPPPGVDIKIERKQKPGVNQYQTSLIISGIDKQVVGQTCANLHNLRRPDAYKGKGVRYANRPMKLKPGKSAK
jgi:large subunit ribosomal protein L6